MLNFKHIRKSAYKNRFIDKPLSIHTLVQQFFGRVCVTWGLVILENLLMALIPLLIGFAIDDLIASNTDKLWLLTAVMLGLTVVAVVRRIYDTRAYGDIRVQLGIEVVERHQKQQVSTRSARLDMARELVDFFENTVPELITATVQLLVALVILWHFHWQLAVSALIMTMIMLLIYSLFHGQFYIFNGRVNAQKERQVTVLTKSRPLALRHHLMVLNKWEIKLSDAEAVLYGLIFVAVIAFITANLWQSVNLIELTAGIIFSVVTYSWEYVEALILLPMALQEWARLREITDRINSKANNKAE